jgi:UPF0716 protein FxsA
MLWWLSILGLSAYAMLEVWLILVINQLIGMTYTLAWLVGGAFYGSIMLRWQGVAALRRINRQLQAEKLPIRALMELAFVIVGALLTIVPGFFSDAVGLILLFPPLRWLITHLLCRIFSPLLPEENSAEPWSSTA